MKERALNRGGDVFKDLWTTDNLPEVGLNFCCFGFMGRESVIYFAKKYKM